VNIGANLTLSLRSRNDSLTSLHYARFRESVSVRRFSDRVPSSAADPDEAWSRDDVHGNEARVRLIAALIGSLTLLALVLPIHP
jgi:hypothetical protein